jgi:uncharacterized protein YegP (UPF0339 family)
MYYEIVSASGGFRARLKSNNHEIVWWTEVYTRKAGAQNAINIAKGSASAPVYDES